MHFLTIMLISWLSFGVVTIFAFLWLGRKGVQALDQPTKKEPAFELRKKQPAVMSSNAA